MDSDKRLHLPTVVMPGYIGVGLHPNYLTLKKQQRLSLAFQDAIREEENSVDYGGCHITSEMLQYETDFALSQLRSAARLYLPREPDRRRLLLDMEVPAAHFAESYKMHWEDLVSSVRSTSAQ
jgi:hypothetical protein